MVKERLKAWPLTVRVPAVAAALIVAVAFATSQAATAWFFRQQEASLQRLAAVYLDGLSASILPYVLTGDRPPIAAALQRMMLFHQGIRERRLIVTTPEGEELANVAIGGSDGTPRPTAKVLRALETGPGVTVDERSGSGWAYRSLERDGHLIARIYAELDLSDLQEQRRNLRLAAALLTLAFSFLSAALGYLLVRRMLLPLQALTVRLRQAEGGELASIPEHDLGPSSTEFGQLQRGFNAMVAGVHEREEFAARLAERDKMATLGQLTATIAHEVRNPLGGLFNAVDTVRKFGSDPAVRNQGLDLVERGLASIRDVVGATLATYRSPAEARHLTPADFEDLRVLAEPEARRRRVRLDWSLEIEREIPVDATRTRQIALNLLLNACMASPAGGTVRFAAAIDRDRLTVMITDSGPGLPPDLAAALEGRGGDAPKAADSAQGGIGLTVVARLVADLGGSMTVSTNEGAPGSRILLALPLREVPSDAAA
jgi:signal transduction histidine kinase